MGVGTMNTEGLNVRTQDMDATGSSVVSYAKTFEENLLSLKTEVDNLMKVWDRNIDENADSFFKSYEQRSELFNDLQVLLDKLGKALSTSAGYYSDSQKKIANNIDDMFSGKI